MTYDDFRRRADAVRCLPLEAVLSQRGARRDRRDRAQWRTERGPLTVTGAKFFNWQHQQGGGGAIDLVMHLGGLDYPAAVLWLEQHLGYSHTAAPSANWNVVCSPATSTGDCATTQSRPLRLPVANRRNLQRVRCYLSEQRRLAPRILEPLFDTEKIYADQRGNAVFLMVAGKANHPIGAELRGTGRRVWRGLAPGTRKDAGYFWIGEAGSPHIILCESAIDAISCFQLRGACICISTAGIRPQPAWLQPLLDRDYDIYCGFDDDSAGNAVAQQMITLQPSITRLCPPAHDWNDALLEHP